MSLLEHHLERSGPKGVHTVYANDWFGFIRYLLHRNRGYGQRKVLNLLNEVIELACLAWIVDIQYLRSLILIPLAHVTINYLQEYHWQLTRHAPRSWLERRLNRIDLSFWAMTLMLLGSLGFALDRATRSDPLVLLIFALRAGQALLQTGLAPWVARTTAFKRIRPNVPFIWGSSAFAWAGSGVAMFLPLGIYYAIIVPALFNGVRMAQELWFFRIVRGENRRSRLLPRIPAKQPEDSREIKPLLWMVGGHFILLALASHRLQSYLGLGGVFVPFFLLVFFDRILTRPLRSIAVDLLRLERRGQSLLKIGLMNRILLITGMMIGCVAVWLGSRAGRSVVYPAAIVSICFQLFVSNAFIFGKRIPARSNRKAMESDRIWYWSSIPLWVLLCLPGRPVMVGFSLLGVIWALWGWFRVRGMFESGVRYAYREGFEWRTVLPLWHAFFERVVGSGMMLHSLDRKRKIIEYQDPAQWEALQNEFPLNIRKRFRVDQIPVPHEFPVPPGGTPAYCDAFGFWRQVYTGRKMTLQEAEFLHWVASEWRRYPFLAGKKRSFKSRHQEGSRLRGGPLGPGDQELWICS